jgi:cyanate permease
LLTALYGVIYWAPSVVKTFGVTGTQNGMLVFFPWLVDAVLLLLLPRLFRSKDNIRVLIGLLVLGSAVFAAAVPIEDSYFRYAMLVIGIPCISLALTFYWPFPARLFSGAAAAAGLATINSIGNLGGLFGQNLMPALAQAGGSASYALLAPCVCLGLFALGAIIVMVFGKRAPA